MRKKWDIGLADDYFKKEEYQLLTKEYTNNKIPLKCICKEGHICFIGLGNFLSGTRCNICSTKRGSSKRKVDFDLIKDSFKKEDYILLTTEYENNKQKLEYICPKGHKNYTSWGKWVQGGRCPDCYNDIRSEIQRLDYESVKGKFNKCNYKLLTETYINSSQKLDYICSEGHKNSIRYADFYKGVRCPSCSHIRSNAELEIFSIIKEWFSDSENGDRELINPLELDIIIPSLKIAIEYCGLYWHNEIYRNKNYHIEKLKKCSDIGYKLITIFEDEWVNKKNIVISRLKNILGISDNNRIYARKCKIKEIDSKLKNDFLEKNHLQGKDTAGIKLGAFFGGNLVSVMTFRKGNITKGAKSEDSVFELNRFCSDRNYIVVGVASKLLTYFIRNYTPKKIYSYSDRRWSIGNLYNKLGFEKSHDSKPNYWYVVGINRVHRFNFRKSILKDKLENFDESLSERVNMLNNKYNRIWDCGNTKWILNFQEE